MLHQLSLAALELLKLSCQKPFLPEPGSRFDETQNLTRRNMAHASTGTLAIRVMDRTDLEQAIDWAASEGWNPGLKDAECFQAADPAGFLIGCLDGQPIGCISVVRYSRTFGFLGFYIVRPDRRGQGFGYRLWQAGMGYLEDCTVGLDGVVAQQENYARSGFVLAHRNVRFGGSPLVEAPRDKRLRLVGPDLIAPVLCRAARGLSALLAQAGGPDCRCLRGGWDNQGLWRHSGMPRRL